MPESLKPLANLLPTQMLDNEGHAPLLIRNQTYSTVPAMQKILPPHSLLFPRFGGGEDALLLKSGLSGLKKRKKFVIVFLLLPAIDNA
jgi:hypothetical protein